MNIEPVRGYMYVEAPEAPKAPDGIYIPIMENKSEKVSLGKVTAVDRNISEGHRYIKIGNVLLYKTEDGLKYENGVLVHQDSIIASLPQ